MLCVTDVGKSPCSCRVSVSNSVVPAAGLKGSLGAALRLLVQIQNRLVTLRSFRTDAAFGNVLVVNQLSLSTL